MVRSSSENSADLCRNKGVELYTRTIQGTLHAHEVFFSFPELFCACLEDSKGSGKQFLVSKSGDCTWLREGDDAALFFQQWKEKLTRAPIDFPAIQHLIYAAYEVSTCFERLPHAKTAPPEGLLCLHQPDWSICFDTDKRQIHLASLLGEDHLDEVEALLFENQVTSQPMTSYDLQAIIETSSNPYEALVERVKAYVVAGDVFQVNIARFWHLPFQKRALIPLYAQLRQVNPAPFSCFVELDGLTLLSASPERLFSLSADGVVEARPIAGTRRRSDGEEDDMKLHHELLLSDKERAEHIMLVDLERNDLGRVCKAGTISVNEMMSIEKYATVQHIVSNVRGDLGDAHDVVDLFQAMFPGGTITGCPKVRCMEIIHELEHQARGPYTGSVGYTAWDGSSDMNILIRTFWHHDGNLHWAAGAGIVSDSNSVHERIETEHKAAGLLRSLQQK